MLQNATPLRKSAPWPPNISHEHVFYTAPATENASLQILFKCPMPAIVFGHATKPSRFAHFWRGAQSLAPATRNGIWTSKSGPNVVCCVHFDFEMCFAPQRRAIFWHLNFQKWSDNGVFCTFWLRNVLRATTACTFSTSQLPKVVRGWGVLYIFTSKCASRHNGVHFFDISTSKSGPKTVCFVHFDLEMCSAPQRRAIFHLSSGQLALASWLRTRRFSEPTFQPSGATNHWKNTVLRDFPTWYYLFAHLHLLSSDSFSSLIFSLLYNIIFLFSVPLPCSAFHLSILSEVWLLNFLRICKSSTNGLCSLLNYQKVVSIYPPNHYSYHVKQQIINNHPTLGLTDFFQDDTMCWFVESNSLHGHILMLQHPIKTLLRRSLRKTISYWWSTHFISHIEFRMVGWVESSIDKHQLPQFEHRKMMSNAAVSCLSWPQLVRYIYDKPLHLIVFSNRKKKTWNPMNSSMNHHQNPMSNYNVLPIKSV